LFLLPDGFNGHWQRIAAYGTIFAQRAAQICQQKDDLVVRIFGYSLSEIKPWRMA